MIKQVILIRVFFLCLGLVLGQQKDIVQKDYDHLFDGIDFIQAQQQMMVSVDENNNNSGESGDGPSEDPLSDASTTETNLKMDIERIVSLRLFHHYPK